MIERREFLRLATAAGVTATSIRRALALPAEARSRSIEDVQHIVVLMQENRSFDHYFGTLRGVRGHNDRFPVRRADGKPVWFQPREENPDAALLPFHLDSKRTGAQAVQWLDHSWVKTHMALNGGRQDRWPAAKTNMTMGHYTRADIPFHFELADAFTICDHYFCSVPGPTHPNRMFLMSGTNDPAGRGGGPLVDNADIVDDGKLPPFTWTTYPERLEQAGISWQVYQQGLDWKDPYNGNYGLNVLQNFRQFIDAPQDSPLRERGYSIRTLSQFAADARAGKLPQVSWLMPPAAFSEHPKYMPAYGATYISGVLDALTADPGLWGRTVLLVMYDENDGYFDHMVPPQPPTPVLPGASTVSTAGEVHDVVNLGHRPTYSRDMLPYGLGPRVPMFAVSPWSKGGFVNSQVFDHTSVIRFIEARFGVAEPNISPWRRAICGDLTTAFDFTEPRPTPARRISTAGFRSMADDEVSTLPAPSVPDGPGTLLAQEPGQRPARALPYALAADFAGSAERVELVLRNTGAAGACFYVYRDGGEHPPLRYTVAAAHQLAVTLPAGAGQLSLYGPNGFFRAYVPGKGGFRTLAQPRPDGCLHLVLANASASPVCVRIRDNAYGAPECDLAIAANRTHQLALHLAASDHWYDVTLQAGSAQWRLAGHVETGAASLTDPAAKAPVLS